MTLMTLSVKTPKMRRSELVDIKNISERIPKKIIVRTTDLFSLIRIPNFLIILFLTILFSMNIFDYTSNNVY